MQGNKFRFELSVLLSSISFITDIKKFGCMGRHELVRMFGATALGAAWQPFSIAITVFGIGVIFGQLFNTPVAKYLPYLCLGIISWQAFTGTLNEAANCLNASITSETPYHSLIIFPVRVISKNIFMCCINFSVYIVVASVFSLTPSMYQILFFLIGFFIFFWNLLFVGIIFSLIGALYKDFSHVIRNILQLAFFLTPIMWEAKSLQYDWVFNFNPIYHMVNLLRSPLLETDFSLLSVLVMSVIGLFASAISLFVWSGYIWLAPYRN